MKIKKIVAFMLALCMMVTSIAACSEEGGDETESSAESSSVTRGANTASPLHITVDRDSGKTEINRPQSAEQPMADDGSWTVFVYLCGSDLESDNSAATGDLAEMCAATASDKVRFVIQTGGAKAWQNEYVSAGKIGRFIIENNQIVALGETSDASMGDSGTLADFLKWGVKEYPAEHMGVIFWNHGGGSISGVCFDELHDSDSLGVREMDSALYSAFETMSDRFEFIGFDACLMGTVETANIMASYARYMIGSQELEPGNGWDYTVIGNYLAENPECNGADIGKVICDGFYDSCAKISQEDGATLSVIDLDKIDDLVKAFNTFAKAIYEESATTSTLASMIRGIQSVDNFGGNNKSEGYTNMVDLGGLINSCNDVADVQAAIDAINAAVIYNKTGSQHNGCSGLSIYYPLAVRGSQELGIFENVSISPFYSSFVDRQDFSSSINYTEEQQGGEEQSQGSEEQSGDTEAYYDEETGYYYFTQDGVQYCYDDQAQQYWYYDEQSDSWLEAQADASRSYKNKDYSRSNDNFGYDDSYWFSNNNTWEMKIDYTVDSQTGTYRSNTPKNDHWDYADKFEQTGESKYITFLKKPNINSDGVFNFTLDAKGVDRAAAVYGTVLQVLDDTNEALILGETFDVDCDWEKGHFEDGFDGYWLSLPDGQNLATYIVDQTEDYVVYTSPILLNGNETNLRFKQMLSDNSVVVEGTWDGIDEHGASAKEIRPIVKGDKITPLYEAMSLDTLEENDYLGQEYTVDADFTIDYSLLDEADFLYAFCVDDIYNDYYMSDFVELNVDADGNVSYYVEE